MREQIEQGQTAMLATMKTVFYADGQPCATNHTGWNVQKYCAVRGWQPITPDPFDAKADAREFMAFAVSLDPAAEYRLYESVRYPA